MGDIEYNDIYDKMYDIVKEASYLGATWFELEDMLHDVMKFNDIPSEEEMRKWTNC